MRAKHPLSHFPICQQAPTLEPELEPWGQRTCYIADPEGNLIEIGSWNKPYEEKDMTEG